MSSNYSVIQYVPNPIANERINIGIIAFNEHLVKTQFIKSWSRIHNFATDKKDLEYLKEFQERVEKLASSGLLFSDNIADKNSNLARLTKISHSWGNSIQLTQPKASLIDPETLLSTIAGDLLVD